MTRTETDAQAWGLVRTALAHASNRGGWAATGNMPIAEAEALDDADASALADQLKAIYTGNALICPVHKVPLVDGICPQRVHRGR